MTLVELILNSWWVVAIQRCQAFTWYNFLLAAPCQWSHESRDATGFSYGSIDTCDGGDFIDEVLEI